MRSALVFSGQGSYIKHMSMDLLDSPKVAALWERMKDCMMRNFGVPLQHIITDNPTRIHIADDALNTEQVCQRSCKVILNSPESSSRSREVAHPNGVMSYTYIAQPCILAAQMVALESLKERYGLCMENFHTVAGHSLGEFSALCANGLFSPETALDLTFKRGLLMERILGNRNRDTFRMYACNPLRAKLDDDPRRADDMFFVLVELIARSLSHTTSFVEVVNYNVVHEQYVVAGDSVGLATLGKCLDPQFRATACGTGAPLDGVVRTALTSVRFDNNDGIIPHLCDSPSRDFVTSAFRKYGVRSVFRRFLRGPDDGNTPSLDELTHLTLQEDGRSGLKKKSWFVPLSIEVPFHSSHLRRCMDEFLPVIRSALPDEGALREVLSVPTDAGRAPNGLRPVWVTNLTGSVFKPLDADFQKSVEEVIYSLNIGEIQHRGRYEPARVFQAFREGVKDRSAREICAVVLAAQLAHGVLWIDVMDEIVMGENCSRIVEVAPKRTVADMFKRTEFTRSSELKEPCALQIKSYPSDARFFF